MILTLKLIHDRCADEGACWIWQQGVNSAGCPIARDAGSSSAVSVRRRVWELKHGERARRGFFIVAKCRRRLCVSPECVLQLSGKAYMLWLNRHGCINSLTHRASATIAARARSTTMDERKAAQIRERIKAGEDRGRVAADFGIRRDRANAIARGDQWAPAVRGASVFTTAHRA